MQAECPGINTVCVDLSDWSVAQAATEAIGEIDMLVNNAGVGIVEAFLEMTESNYDNTFKVNVAAVLSVSQVVAKGMVERKSGKNYINC